MSRVSHILYLKKNAVAAMCVASDHTTPTSMHAENLFTDNGCHREAVEAVSEGLPEPDAVASFACRGGQTHY